MNFGEIILEFLFKFIIFYFLFIILKFFYKVNSDLSTPSFLQKTENFDTSTRL